MAILNKDRLKQQIKENEFFKVYFFYGNEGYLKQQYTDYIVSKAVDSKFRDLNYEKYDGKETELEQILDRAVTFPMFCDKRCIVVEGHEFEGMKPPEIKKLDARLAGLPDSTILIFVQDDSEKKPAKALIEAFGKHGAVCEFNKKTAAVLREDVIAMANKYNCQMNSSTASYFVNYVGCDINTLKNEVLKVCSYVGKGTVKKEQINKLCIKYINPDEARPYKLTDAIIKCNLDRAYEMLDILFSQNFDAKYILGVIVGAYVNMYRVKVMTVNNRSDAEITENFNIKYPSSIRNDCAKITLPVLREIIDILAEADFRIKTTAKENQPLFLEQLIVRIVATERRK